MSIHEATKGYVVIFVIDTVSEDVLVTPIEESLGAMTLAAIILNFESDDTGSYDEMVSALNGRGPYNYTPKKLDHGFKNKVTPPAKYSIKENLVLELMDLPSYLCYVFSRTNNTLQLLL